MLTEAKPHQYTVDDYHRMGETGILGEDDRVELIRGEVIEMSPIGGPHMTCVNFLNELLVSRFHGRLIVSIQNPVRLDGTSEPEPDVALIKRRQGHKSDEVPNPSEVLGVMEVSDSTLAYDRAEKLPLYAAAGIPEAWIIDLNGRAIECFSKPVGGIYRLSTRAERGEKLESTVLPDLTLSVDEVLRI